MILLVTGTKSELVGDCSFLQLLAVHPWSPSFLSTFSLSRFVQRLVQLLTCLGTLMIPCETLFMSFGKCFAAVGSSHAAKIGSCGL